jgi:hypothetical protein
MPRPRAVRRFSAVAADPQGKVTDKVFFDVEIGGEPAGRITIGLFGASTLGPVAFCLPRFLALMASHLMLRCGSPPRGASTHLSNFSEDQATVCVKHLIEGIVRPVSASSCHLKAVGVDLCLLDVPI